MTTALERRERALFQDIEQAANLPKGSISLVGLKLTDPDMKFKEWETLGHALGALRRWTSWAIGDWYIFGEALYGQDASQATDSTRADRMDALMRVTGLAPATLANYASICQRIALSRRRVELDFGVHEPVASLEPDEQTEWLQRAIDEGWGRDELRNAIREAKSPAAAPADSPVVLDPVPDGLTMAERIEQAARLVYHQAQRASNGDVVVPAEPWAQLGAALGEE